MEAKARSRTWPYTCGLKDTEGGPHLVRRAHLPPEEVEAFVRQVEEELAGVGRGRSGAPVAVMGPPQTQAEVHAPGAPVAVEVRLPIPRGTPTPEGFESVEVASVPVAYTVHHGAAGGLTAAEEVLVGWIRLKALDAAREVHRVYLKRGKNPRKHVTEVQVPLER